MPAFLKTPEDERLWTKAKARAKDEGQEGNWAYVTGIWKRMKGKTAEMKPDYKFKTAYYARDPKKGDSIQITEPCPATHRITKQPETLRKGTIYSVMDIRRGPQGDVAIVTGPGGAFSIDLQFDDDKFKILPMAFAHYASDPVARVAARYISAAIDKETWDLAMEIARLANWRLDVESLYNKLLPGFFKSLPNSTLALWVKAWAAQDDAFWMDGEMGMNPDQLLKMHVQQWKKESPKAQVRRIRDLLKIPSIRDQFVRAGIKTADKYPGGRADKKNPGDFDQEQLTKGIKVEREHTDDPELAREITMDHLTESPDYYRALAKMEKGLEGKTAKTDAPEYVKTPRDKALWTKADGLAAKSGHHENYAYITAIFRRMEPDCFKRKAPAGPKQQSLFPKSASMSRYCGFYQATNGKWYMDLADEEYGDWEDSDTYGPFDSVQHAKDFLGRHFSNPGGSQTSSVKKPVPTHDPSGGKVIDPREYERRIIRLAHELEKTIETTYVVHHDDGRETAINISQHFPSRTMAREACMINTPTNLPPVGARLTGILVKPWGTYLLFDSGTSVALHVDFADNRPVIQRGDSDNPVERVASQWMKNADSLSPENIPGIGSRVISIQAVGPDRVSLLFDHGQTLSVVLWDEKNPYPALDFVRDNWELETEAEKNKDPEREDCSETSSCLDSFYRYIDKHHDDRNKNRRTP